MSAFGVLRKWLEHSGTALARIKLTSWQTTMRESEPRCDGRYAREREQDFHLFVCDAVGRITGGTSVSLTIGRSL
jgi:hypothetical protein